MTTAMQRPAARPPLTDVRREAPFKLRSLSDGEPNDGLTLDGYGAVFNRQTVIDSWEGKFKEQVAPGAMRKSFRESPPKIQFDHGRHPLIGSIPIAKLQRAEEEVDPDLAPEGGAHIVARVFDNWLMEPVRDAIAGGAVDGMSFKVAVIREQWHLPDGTLVKDDAQLREELRRTWYEDVPDEELLLRTLKELSVPEIGPVVWPAYTATSVSVRSTDRLALLDLRRLDDPEQQRLLADPEQRKLLARAVFLADTADQPGDAPQPTAPPERRAAGEHPSRGPALPDAPRSTDTLLSAGEHPSPITDRPRNDEIVRKAGDILRQIAEDKKERRYGRY